MQLHALGNSFPTKNIGIVISSGMFSPCPRSVTAVVSGDHDGVSIMDGFVDLLDAGKCIVYLVHIFRCHPAVVVTALCRLFPPDTDTQNPALSGQSGKGLPA